MDVIARGEKVDVKGLLSSKSRDYLLTTKRGKRIPIDCLDGKYVIVCCLYLCFSIDVHTNTTNMLRRLEALIDDLSVQQKADDVILVLVVKFTPPFDRMNLPRLLDHLLSKTSLDCLTIPYKDSESRDTICKRIDFCDDDDPCLIVVHPDGTVLQEDAFFLRLYGALSFPFTDDQFDKIDYSDHIMKSRFRCTDSPISLPELLQCHYLYQIGDDTFKISTSDLDRDSVVGIYLCNVNFERLGFMSHLQSIHKTCRDKGLDFEIVLVPAPHGWYSDPNTHYKYVKDAALKDATSSTWWTMPFCDKICRTLWRLFGTHAYDELIILPHSGLPGELHGRQMVDLYGFDAYPFTRDVVIDWQIHELRSVTLKQLVGEDFYTLCQLHDKRVLLYLDTPDFSILDGSHSRIMFEAIPMMQSMYPDSQVVFVPLELVSGAAKESETTHKKCKTTQTWPVLPLELREKVLNHVSHGGFDSPDVVAFGTDGKILSVKALNRMPKPGMVGSDTKSPFDDTLADDMFDFMQRSFII